MNDFKTLLESKNAIARNIDYGIRIDKTKDAIQAAGSFVYALLGEASPIYRSLSYVNSVKNAKIFIEGPSTGLEVFKAIRANKKGFFFFFGKSPTVQEIAALQATGVYYKAFDTVDAVNRFLETNLSRNKVFDENFGDPSSVDFKESVLRTLKNPKERLALLHSIGKY